MEPTNPTIETPHPRRTTFLTGREVLGRTRKGLERAIDAVSSASASEPRTAMFRTHLEGRLRDLLRAVERSEREAPRPLLDELTQYSAPVPDRLELRLDEDGRDDLAACAWRILDELADVFREMAAAAEKTPVREIHQALGQKVVTVQKRLEEDRQRLELL
jgi:hypothetical protein